MARFVVSKSAALKQYSIIKKHADLVSYSCKTNPCIAQILEKNTDCMFSMHLKTELNSIRDWQRTVFLAQAVDEALMLELTNKGIRWFVVDNQEDLCTITSFAKKHDVRLNLLLRLKLRQHTLKTEKYYLFGMNSEVIAEKIRQIRSDLNSRIELLGIHFHRQTQNMSEWNMKYELEDTLGDIMESIDLVNIGGGLPSEYANTNRAVIEGIIKKIDEFRAWLNSKKVRMMIEPGRFIAAPSVRLETKIMGVHESTIIVDASVYNCDMDALIVPVKLLVEGELDSTTGKPFVVKGITPCQLDLFRYRVYLKNPRKGDRLTFLNAGAYNFASDFCSLEKIETVVVD